MPNIHKKQRLWSSSFGMDYPPTAKLCVISEFDPIPATTFFRMIPQPKILSRMPYAEHNTPSHPIISFSWQNQDLQSIPDM